ncbi:MAG TPA: alpha/beta hydrolase [Caulobacteraceae bacterium]|jgi:acetyl esterase/lipase
MSLELALDQPRLGFLDMAPCWRRPELPRRLMNRAIQVGVDVVMRRTARLQRTDPAAFAREIKLWRERAVRWDATAASQVNVEAIKVAAPHAGLTAPPVPADWFAPLKGEPRGFVFYVHGGSFMFERSPALTELVIRFAARAGARVFAPNYRLAPEHPCPAAVDDIVAAFRWFRDTWPDEPVVALAESAGGSILLAALQALRDAGEELPDGVVLLSPWVDLSLQSWSLIATTLAGGTGATMGALALMAHFYLEDLPATDPVASPLFGDFAGFPPMLIHASRGDMLFDDSVRLADKVRVANGDLTVRLWAENAHVFEKAFNDQSRQSIEIAGDFIRRHLG